MMIPGRALADTDLRDQYGTRNLDAAKHIDNAIHLEADKKSDDALNEINAAVKADPSCAMAWYWLGNIKCDISDLDGGIDAYKSCAAIDNPKSVEITTDAKTNLGIVLGQLKRYNESEYWFARAITEDPSDVAHENAKDYRNLAITLHLDNQDLAASLAAITGHEIDPDHVEQGMIDAFFKSGQGQEAARVLSLQMELPKVVVRNEPIAFTPVVMAAPVKDKFMRLLADPKGEYVLAIPADDHFYFIDTLTDAPPIARMQKIAGGKISAACLAGGDLYIAVANPPAPLAKLVEIDPLSGKTVNTWNFADGAPTSIAVLPSKKLAYFCVDGDINFMSLADGKITKTDDPGQMVVADLAEKYVYAREKDESVENGQTVIIDGSPVYIESDHFDWQETVIFKYFVTPSKLLPAAMRLDASANGYDVTVSPDGQFVACPGGGGWRPASGSGGYNIAVFPTADFNKVHNAFAMDAYPTGCTFNPLTHEFVGIRKDDAKVYDLATDAPGTPAATLHGPFNGQGVWSGDGRLLFLAGDDGGVSIYKQDLSTSEMALSHSWWVPILPRAASQTSVAGAAHGAPQVNPALVHYAPATDRAQLQKNLALALATKPTDQPLAWRDYPQYANAAALAAIDDPDTATADPGVRIYLLNKALAKDPQNNALRFFIAEATVKAGQNSMANTRLLDAIHGDAGRTDITLNSLRDLAVVCSAGNQDIEAADALAHALILDRVSPQTIHQLVPLLEKLNFSAEAEKLKSENAAAGGDAGPNLPALAAPAGDAPVLSAAALFQKSAPSVVLVHCGDAAGTAVCVATGGILITSLHVVAHGNEINVFPFTVQNGKPSACNRIPRKSSPVPSRMIWPS
jgi:Tfp pilus assembly protein PilF